MDKWRYSVPIKCKCECGKYGGAETYNKTFDVQSFNSSEAEHDGETKYYKVYYCEECKSKYGKEIEI